MADLNYQHAYVEMRKLLSLQLNVLIGNWLDEPENKDNPNRDKMTEALALSFEFCNKPLEKTLASHDMSIKGLMACMNTLIEVNEGTGSYIRFIPYWQVFSSELDLSRQATFDSNAPHITITPDLIKEIQHAEF